MRVTSITQTISPSQPYWYKNTIHQQSHSACIPVDYLFMGVDRYGVNYYQFHLPDTARVFYYLAFLCGSSTGLFFKGSLCKLSGLCQVIHLLKQNRLKYYIEILFETAFCFEIPITLVFWTFLFKILLDNNASRIFCFI